MISSTRFLVGCLVLFALTSSVSAQINWCAKTFSPGGGPGAPLNGVTATDVDRDGDGDAISFTGTGGAGILWHENLGGRGEAWRTNFVWPERATDAVAADMRGRGIFDVAACSEEDDRIVWYENPAPFFNGASWQETEISRTEASPRSLWVGQVDRDNDRDVLVGLGGDTDEVWWYENLGSGRNWMGARISTTSILDPEVTGADVDGNGDPDALAISRDGRILWFQNTAGDGSAWVEHVIATGVTGLLSITAADMDRDLDADVAVGTSDGRILLYGNTSGDGTSWTVTTLLMTANPVSDLRFSDVDRDNDVDLIAANGPTVWFLDNAQGDGSSWPAQSVVSGLSSPAVSVFASFLDADSDRDVLVATSPGSITWHQNGCVTSPISMGGRGGVNARCSDGVTDILFVNSSSGGNERTIEVPRGNPLVFSIREAPANRGELLPSPAIIYIWAALPTASDIVELPRGFGKMCFGPAFLATRAADVTWNSIGSTPRASQHDAPTAPPMIPDGGILVFLHLANGINRTLDLTVQGIVPDGCSGANQPYSVTNAVAVRIVP